MEQVPVKNPGNTLTASEFNNLDSQEAQNCVLNSEQSFNASDNTQLYQSFLRTASSGNHYVDSGTANNYILNDISSYAPITIFPNRVIVRFSPLNTNTGPATASINGIVGFNILDISGAPLVGGELQAGEYATLVKVGGGANFRLTVFNDSDVTLRTALANETYGSEGSKLVGGNSLTSNDILPCAFGYIFWDGADYTVLNGVNLGSIQRLGAGNVRVNFNIDLGTSNYVAEAYVNDAGASQYSTANAYSFFSTYLSVALFFNTSTMGDLSFFIQVSYNSQPQLKRRGA